MKAQNVRVERINILLVEDNALDAQIVRDMLKEETLSASFHVDHVAYMSEAIDRLRLEKYDLVLLDLTLPDVQGMDTVKSLLGPFPNVPTVVLSGFKGETLAISAVQYGAQDYLIKGQVDRPLLTRAILYAIERKRSESHINQLAYYDSLTGLPNRTLLHDRLSLALARARRTKQVLAVMFLDLDNFKTINDTLGHDVGDLVLKEVAARLKMCLRDVDTVARLGGDEFTLLLPDIPREEDVIMLAERILGVLKPPCCIAERELFVTTSIGISRYPADGEDQWALLKNADAAMYRAKEQGTNNYQFFSQGMNVKASERLNLGNALRRALKENEFTLHYQPQFDVVGGQIIGLEALVRWEHPDWGLVSPGQFIPLAEESGLIVPLGDWILRTACEQNVRWREEGLPRVPVAVNLSHRQFDSGTFSEMVTRVLRETDLDPRYLELELVESGFMHTKEVIIEALVRLKSLGVRIAIDDFGAGYSSFRHLKAFPIDTLKIDQSYIRDSTNDPSDAAIVTAIISLGHSMGFKVVAEGVETAEQFNFLRTQGCDIIQGYFMSTPVPADDVTGLFKGRF